MTKEQQLPEKIAAIKARGYAVWASKDLGLDFVGRFDTTRIPVTGVRHVRQWDIQVDDERELPGHERASVPDEELWEIVLKARDGSTYEVNSAYLVAAPE